MDKPGVLFDDRPKDMAGMIRGIGAAAYGDFCDPWGAAHHPRRGPNP